MLYALWSTSLPGTSYVMYIDKLYLCTLGVLNALSFVCWMYKHQLTQVLCVLMLLMKINISLLGLKCTQLHINVVCFINNQSLIVYILCGNINNAMCN